MHTFSLALFNLINLASAHELAGDDVEASGDDVGAVEMPCFGELLIITGEVWDAVEVGLADEMVDACVDLDGVINPNGYA